MPSVTKSSRTFALIAVICFVSLYLCFSPCDADTLERSFHDTINLGNERFEKGDYTAAISYYEKARDIYPEVPLPSVLIGEVWYQIGDFNAAIENADYALTLDNDHFAALFLRAKCLEVEGKTQDALGLYNYLYKKDPENVNVILGRARTSAVLFGPEQGIKVLLDVSDEQGGLSSPPLLDLLGDLYSDAGETDKAKSAYVLVVQRDPDYGTTLQKLYDLAALPVPADQIPKSTEDSVTATNPDRAREWFEKGIYLMKRRAYDEAIKHFAYAYGNDPSLAEDVLVNVGYAYLKLGNHEQANSYLLTALNENPKNTLAWNSLGVIAEKRGSVEKARNCYQIALSINPSLSSAWWNLMVMEGKLLVYGIGGIAALLALRGMLLFFAWRHSLKERNPYQSILSWTGALLGAFLGGLVASNFILSYRFLGFFNIIIGCILLGWYLARQYRAKFLPVTEPGAIPYSDLNFFDRTPYLTAGLIVAALYGGLANIYYCPTEFSGTIEGMIAGVFLLYFAFDLTLCSTHSQKEDLTPRIRSDWAFFLLTISVFFSIVFSQVTNISVVTFNESTTGKIFEILLFVGLLMLIYSLPKNIHFTLRRIGFIIVYFIIFSIVGILYFTLLNLFEFAVTTISEIPLFFIPVGFIAGHLLFLPFDKKGSEIKIKT